MKSLMLLNFSVALILGLAPGAALSEDSEGPTSVPSVESAENTTSSDESCDRFDEYRQQQCCYRSEKIKDLQKKEFSIKNDNEETLFDLQKQHDKVLADIKIQEGVLALQEDYLEYMQRLDNPEDQSSGLSQLSSLKKLQQDTRGAIDQAYRLNFLHQAMDELKNENGHFRDENGQLVRAEELYQHAEQKCRENDNKQGLCSLLNPNSDFNQKNNDNVRVSSGELKEMMNNYLLAYGVATEGLDNNEDDLKERHARYEQSLRRIPRSVLREQITAYEEFQKENLNPLVSDGTDSDEENSEIEKIKDCVTKIRYGADIGDCGTGTNFTNSQLEGIVKKISDEVSDQANQILQRGFGSSLSGDERSIVDKVLNSEVYSELENIKERDRDISITDEEKETFNNVFDSLEEKLKLSAKISKDKVDKTQDDFFGAFKEEDPKLLENAKEELMFKLCGAEGKDYSKPEMLKCLEKVNENDTRTTKNEIRQSQDELKGLQKKIDQITSGDKYQRLNSFKNFYAHETKDVCSVEYDDQPLVSYSGQCNSGYGDDQEKVTSLLDSAQNVIAEVEFKENGGPETSVQEFSRIHDYCLNMEEDERAKFENECETATKNYFDVTTDNSELSSDVKEYVSDNMAVYDPSTGDISYKKRRSNWSMFGTASARALASSTGPFMQYQQTRMALPFMRDQAMAQKSFQYWQNQQFTANFFRPGGFTSFGSNGGPSYGVSPFNNTPNFGSRIPMGNPQSLNIP